MTLVELIRIICIAGILASLYDQPFYQSVSICGVQVIYIFIFVIAERPSRNLLMGYISFFLRLFIELALAAIFGISLWLTLNK